MHRSSVFLSALLLMSSLAWADESQHHEELTTNQLGMVHFSISCAASAQEPFTRGIALLHSFWYEESAKSFQQAAKEDPQCAIAHWGIAMSLWHQLWNDPDDATLKHGADEVRQAKVLRPSDRREHDYIAATAAFYGGSAKRSLKNRKAAYRRAMERVYLRHPEDHEAAAFYALALIGSDRKKAAAILEKLFAAEPNHPGVAHYLIHTYDSPDMAQMGLPAARRYAQLAPAAPHAVHMPSHIFARLGLWQEDIHSNLASIAATEKGEAMHMSGEGHQFHAMDFLVYAYLQSGHEADAQGVIDQVKAMSPMKDMYGTDGDPRLAAIIEFEASYALELHDWTRAAALQPVAGAELGDDLMTHWARAIGAARSHHPAQARVEIVEIEKIRKQLVEQKKPQFLVDLAGRDRQEADAWAMYVEGKQDAAIAEMRPLAEKDEGNFEASDEVPVREMLGDMLLEASHPDLALVEYKADLKANPNRFNALYGAAKAAEMLGKRDEAAAYYRQLIKQCEGSHSNRPELREAKTVVDKQASLGQNHLGQ